MQVDHDWISALDAWKLFTEVHPELGYRGGIQQFYNFLRRNRDALVAQDAIRRAKRRFWIAHKHRFIDVAFELSTGGL